MNRVRNEADIREEVAMPFLSALGYQGGTKNDIRRELSLSYNRNFLGRKKDTDPPLRGRADYMLAVLGAARWILEVKAPSEEITQDVIEQAITYARHPEVSAIYAAILNGNRFVLFHNTQSSTDEPRVDVNVVTPQKLAEQLAGTLSPAAIRRDWRPPLVDLGKPLAEGFRSTAEIRNGTIVHSEFTWEANFTPDPAGANIINESCRRMAGLRSTITGGRIWRDDVGIIRAKLNWAFPHEDGQEFMRDKKLEEAEYISLNETISHDPENPTVFDVVENINVNKGDKLFDMVRWERKVVGIELLMTYRAQAVGFIKESVFKGELQVEYETTFPARPGAKIIMRGTGTFEVAIGNS